MQELFGTEVFFDGEDLVRLLLRLSIDLLFVGLLVGGVYWRTYRNREHAFTLVTLNVVTFAICVLLRKVPVDLGFALGMFAVFGILRYRTEPIRVRDLTYLFIAIGIGILNGIANKKVSAVELLTVEAIVVAITAAHELLPRKRSDTVPMLYDKLLLLSEDRRAELVADLARRAGLHVTHVEILRIDMLRESAEVVIHHHRGDAGKTS